MDRIQDFKDKKYILLETYKKDNTAVQTPVWFVMLDETIHVVTREDTGKVKPFTKQQISQDCIMYI